MTCLKNFGVWVDQLFEDPSIMLTIFFCNALILGQTTTWLFTSFSLASKHRTKQKQTVQFRISLFQDSNRDYLSILRCSCYQKRLKTTRIVYTVFVTLICGRIGNMYNQYQNGAVSNSSWQSSSKLLSCCFTRTAHARFKKGIISYVYYDFFSSNDHKPPIFFLGISSTLSCDHTDQNRVIVSVSACQRAATESKFPGIAKRSF